MTDRIKTRFSPRTILTIIFTTATLALTPVGQVAAAPNAQAIEASKARVVQHWTRERMQQAIPRDLVIDPRGLGYLRKPDGSLVPYGHNVAARQITSTDATPTAKPTSPGGGGGGSKGGGGKSGGGGGGGSSNDTTPPAISNMDPGSGIVIGASYTFSATVTDTSGVKSVTFVIQYPDGTTTQSFSAAQGSNNTWSKTLQGFSDGNWSWWVQAKDGAKKGGNTGSSSPVSFSVSIPTSGGSNDTVASAAWSNGGAIQTAAGRLYFEMPSSSGWAGYVCSGTVARDNTIGRSIVMTAAHCVYDDANKAFARNVMFIPDQADTTGSGTDLNCSNDPLGCWVPSFGAVDVNWTTRVFPDNIAWDYAYYVVDDTGAHMGASASSSSLDEAAGDLPVSFVTPYHDDGVAGATSLDFTYALGYSYNQDPNFMYCAEDMTTNGSADWWLPSCGLTGGSSGGPWVQPMDTATGSGPIISVNSWGYTSSPGMAGAKLSGTSAECVFTMAKSTDFAAVSTADGQAGTTVICP
jgi:hypothetical protein